MFTRKYWIRGRWLIFFGVIGVVFLLYIMINNAINGPTATAQKDILEKQANQLAHPPSVQLVHRISAQRSASAFITEVFSSPLSFDGLREFYTAEFSQLGFQVAKTNIRNTPDMDEVSASVSYCKGEYTAILRYKGFTNTRDRKTDEWTYAIDLSWWKRGCDPD